MAVSRLRILTLYAYVLIILAAYLGYNSMWKTNISLQSSVGSDNCMYPTLKYDVTSNSIAGDVLSDFITIFVLVVDDNTSPVSSDYIIENGVIQGKFSKGSRWVVRTETFNTFPGALYIVGVYSNNQCRTNPLYINLPLNSYVIGDVVSFDATLVKKDGEMKIIMRGNSVMETQYYLLYKDDDSSVSNSQLFSETNYIGLGKHGQYFTYFVNSTFSTMSYAYVGCRVENIKSNIVQLSLDEPIVYNTPQYASDNQGTIIAKAHHRVKPEPVNPVKNSGNLNGPETKGSGGGRSPIRIRNVQTLRSIVYVRCILIGGPYDIYYMVRPESKERNDPDERTVMRFGEKAGSFEDTSFDIVVTDYVSSVKNFIYIVAVKGKTILGPTRRGFFP